MLLLFSWLLIISTVLGNVQKSEKIRNGFDATISKYPFQAGLLYKSFLICGGTIVSKNMIITAAHCVNKGDKHFFKICVGSVFIKNGKKCNISKIILHPYYNSQKLIFDIAIIKLSVPLIFSSYVKPIELQPLYSEVPNGTKAYISGWGLLDPKNSVAARRLQAAEVRVISNQKCKDIYDNGKFKLTYHHLCAIDQNRGTCSGDSGGPLIAKNKLIGVVSFGINDCDPPNPGVYVNISNVREFIDLYY